MKNILEDIKHNNFQNIYLLYGDEVYLKHQYRDKLLKALQTEEDTMNFAKYEGKGIPENEIIGLADTVPFFSEHRVILLEDSGFFKNAVDRLPDYVKELPEYLVMIFVESEIDKRNRLFKAVSKVGRVVEFSVQKEDTLLTWIAQMLGREGKKITKSDAKLLLSRTGTDMSNISSEVEKLICYAWDRESVRTQDIEAVCSEQMENRIFDMIRAVTEKKQEQALALYYDLLALKEPPMRILYLIARQYNQMLQVKELSENGCGMQEISSKLGIQSFLVRNYLNYGKHYTVQQLLEIVKKCTDTEEAVKTGRMTDTLSVELLIVEFSS